MKWDEGETVLKWDWDALSGFSAAVAAFLSFIAVLISLFTTGYQIRADKKAMRPIVIPELKNVSSNISDIIFDWDTDEKMNKKFSKSVIELKNIGKESAIDIRYSFRMENEDKVKEYFLLSNKFKNNIDKSYVEIKDDDDFGKIAYVYRKRSTGQVFRMVYWMNAYIRTGPSISANSSQPVYLPSYFVAIVNYNFMRNLKYDNEVTIVMPILRLKINFKDIYLKEWSVVYLLSMSSTYDFRDNSNLFATVEHAQVEKMKRVRKSLW